jgi:5'-phosphate synthase pdxT subunit
MVRVGVLAIQGDFEAHSRALASLGADALEVRRPSELDGHRGLVIPGGESTTLLRFMEYEPEWWAGLRRFHARGGAFFGTCAGAILLAREVLNPAQRSLALLDVGVERNGYGRQIDSFEAIGDWSDGSPLEMVFIRAPRIGRVGPGVEVLARLGTEPVLVRQGRIIAATFHPEMTSDLSVHRRFLDVCDGE